MKLRTLVITAIGALGTAVSPALAQITYVSQERSVYARGTCAEETFTAPDFGPFSQSALAICGSNVGTANHNSTLGPGALHLAHDAGAGGGAESYSEFNVVFDLASTVTYSLNASFENGGSGTLTGPGTSITFGAGGVTSSSGTLAPGRYTVFSTVVSPALRPSLSLNLFVQGSSTVGIEVGPITNPANGHEYYRLTPSTWTDAQAFARTLGGHLATIEDSAENQWVRDTLVLPGSALGWIGLNRDGDLPEFAWSSGSTSAFRQWDAGEPNNDGGEEFYVDMVASGNWNDHYNTAFSKGIVEVIPSLYAISWFTVDGGGGMLAGGAYQIAGTVGQPDAGGPFAYDPFKINAGFWPVTAPTCDADFNNDGFVTGDDFDQFVVFFIAGTEEADFNQDGFVTGDDFDAFVVVFQAGC